MTFECADCGEVKEYNGDDWVLAFIKWAKKHICGRECDDLRAKMARLGDSRPS